MASDFIQMGDALLDNARGMALCYATADGLLAPRILATHRERLRNAAQFYRYAGLGLLAGRVRWLAQASEMNAADAWSKFDRLNAGGCGVM